MKEIARDKDFLIQKYEKEKLSMDKIAKLCECNSGTVWYYLKKHGIRKKSKSESILRDRSECDFETAEKTFHDEDWLREKYLNEGLSTTQIGALCGASNKTIHLYLMKFGIRIRTGSEAKLGKKNPMFGKVLSKRHRDALSKSLKGERHPNWKGGRTILEDGRVLVYKPDHPHSGMRGYVRRSRLMVEEALGRLLKPSEQVHHINGDPSDDRNCNFLVCTNSYHSSLEARMRRSKEGS